MSITDKMVQPIIKPIPLKFKFILAKPAPI